MSGTCRECPAGKYLGEKGGTNCKECPKGKFSGAWGSTLNSCALCPRGKYASKPGLVVCSACPVGKFFPGQCRANWTITPDYDQPEDSCGAWNSVEPDNRNKDHCLNTMKEKDCMWGGAWASDECRACPSGRTTSNFLVLSGSSKSSFDDQKL